MTLQKTLRALTVREPWASLIIYGFRFPNRPANRHYKDVENRSWYTSYRGELLIHAGLSIDTDAQKEYGVSTHCGHVIGVVTLVDCIKQSRSEWARRGQFHWLLVDPRIFPTPIPMRGQLRLFQIKVKSLPLSAQHLIKL